MNGSVARGSAVNEEETKIVDDVFVCGQDNCRALRFKYRSSQCLSMKSSNTISKNFHLKWNLLTDFPNEFSFLETNLNFYILIFVSICAILIFAQKNLLSIQSMPDSRLSRRQKDQRVIDRFDHLKNV